MAGNAIERRPRRADEQQAGLGRHAGETAEQVAVVVGQAVEVFVQSSVRAGEQFLQNPMETPFIPSWNRVVSAFPDIQQELLEAVDGPG